MQKRFSKKNGIIKTSFNNKDSLVSAKRDFELDVLEDIRKNSEKSYRRNQKLPHDITLRTKAQRNQIIIKKDEFLTHDQASIEANNDTIEVTDMKPEIDRYDENTQSTSSSQKSPRRILN